MRVGPDVLPGTVEVHARDPARPGAGRTAVRGGRDVDENGRQAGPRPREAARGREGIRSARPTHAAGLAGRRAAAARPGLGAQCRCLAVRPVPARLPRPRGAAPSPGRAGALRGRPRRGRGRGRPGRACGPCAATCATSCRPRSSRRPVGGLRPGGPPAGRRPGGRSRSSTRRCGASGTCPGCEPGRPARGSPRRARDGSARRTLGSHCEECHVEPAGDRPRSGRPQGPRTGTAAGARRRGARLPGRRRVPHRRAPGPEPGVVEITLALHRVFDSPRDKVVWDTGHQAYVHKIVTGRQAGFAHPAPARRPVRLPEPQPSPSTTWSRTATHRRRCPTPRAWPRPTGCAARSGTSSPSSVTARSPAGCAGRR